MLNSDLNFKINIDERRNWLQIHNSFHSTFLSISVCSYSMTLLLLQSQTLTRFIYTYTLQHIEQSYITIRYRLTKRKIQLDAVCRQPMYYSHAAQCETQSMFTFKNVH